MNTTTVAVLQIDQFTETTPSEFRQVMGSVKAPKLVIDLRGNPGGLVESLVVLLVCSWVQNQCFVS